MKKKFILLMLIFANSQVTKPMDCNSAKIWTKRWGNELVFGLILTICAAQQIYTSVDSISSVSNCISIADTLMASQDIPTASLGNKLYSTVCQKGSDFTGFIMPLIYFSLMYGFVKRVQKYRNRAQDYRSRLDDLHRIRHLEQAAAPAVNNAVRNDVLVPVD